MIHRLTKQFLIRTAFIATLAFPTALVVYFAATVQYVPSDEFAYLRLVILILILFIPIFVKYGIQLLLAPWYPLVEFFRARKRPITYLPSVSVLIPAWNEEKGIQATITSVLKTKYPNLEIIVVDDGSTDRTHEKVIAFIEKQKSSIKIKYQRVRNGGKARALNKALQEVEGEIIITIDADSAMDPAAISNIVKHFSDPRVASVAGNVIVGNRTRPIELIQQLEYLYGFYFKRADSILSAVYIVGGAAAAYRTSVMRTLGGFDENIITEDIEFSTRLQNKGYRVRYAADAVVYTEPPSDWKGLCNQRLRWKFGRLQTFYRYRHLFFSTNPKHNVYLSFLILPIALFAEVLLFFEGLLLTLFYGYTFYTNDFLPLLFVIGLLTSIVGMQILIDTKSRYHMNLLLLAPGAWLLFYVLDAVEYQALIRSMWRMFTKRNPVWQQWERVGILARG